jgi:hypothetical protein
MFRVMVTRVGILVEITVNIGHYILKLLIYDLSAASCAEKTASLGPSVAISETACRQLPEGCNVTVLCLEHPSSLLP